MSWKAEEWKDELPHGAITHIQSLEDDVESFKKELAQCQFNNESLESQLENLRQKYDTQLKDVKILEREKVDIQVYLDREIKENQTLNSSLSKKDDMIRDYTETISMLKESFSVAQEDNKKLQNELDFVHNKLAANHEAAKDNDVKITEAQDNDKYKIEELKCRLEAETKEKNYLHNSYEKSVSENLADTKRFEDEIESLHKEIKAFEYQIFSLQKENNKLENKVSAMENEKLKKRSESDKDVSTSGVGEYLGIQLRKFQSESQLIVDHEKTQLLKENKCLVEKIEELERELISGKKNTDNRQFEKSAKNAHYPKKSQDHTDSGLFTRGNSVNTNSQVLTTPLKGDSVFDKEVILSRLAPSEIDAKTHLRIVRTNDSEETEILIQSYKDEICKLKQEITQMKDVYESHMRICSTQSKRSMDKLNSISHTEVVIDELNKKLNNQDEEKQSLVKHLKQQENKYSQLEETFKSFQQKNSSLQKLDELVDIILQKKSSINLVTSDNDLRQFQVDMASKISHMQEEIETSHQDTRKKIKSHIDKVLSCVSHNNLNPPKHSTNNSVSFDQRVTNGGSRASSSCFKHNSKSLSELESLKSRIENIQQSVYGRENELRNVQDERNHLQEELVKMMDVMKKKDEEIGRLSCNYENEKRKVEESDSCFKMEMNALKHEQLEIYEEFREMCENLKKKDIELLNKSKQMKLLSAEWREKEDAMNEKLLKVQQEIDVLTSEKHKLEHENTDCSNDNQLLLSRLNHAEEQLRHVYDNLSRVEDMFYKVKAKGLYS